MRIDLGPGRCIKPKSSYLPAPSLTAPQCDSMRKLKFVVITLLVFVSLGSIGLSAGAGFYFDHVGWHYVSIPIWPLDEKVSIRNITCNSSNVPEEWKGGCTKVYFYNSTEKAWKMWDINKLDVDNDITYMTNGYGYWVYADDVGYTNDFEGTIIDPINDWAWGEMELGWNMMGWTSDSAMNISNAISQIYSKWSKDIKTVWNYDDLVDDLIGNYWPVKGAVKFEPVKGYWNCVFDSNDPTFCEETVPPLMPWQNQWPKLNETSVTRTRAEGIKFQYKYTFSVKYSDSDNDAPSTAIIYVDGVAHDMGEVQPTGEGGTPPNYTEGVVYEYKEILDFGEHTYSFEFNDGKSHTIYEPRDGNKNHTIDVKLPFAIAEPISIKAWMIKELSVGSNVNSRCGHEINLTGISQMGSDFYASFFVMYNDAIETDTIKEGDMDTFFSGSLKIKVADIKYLESLVVVHIQCE